MTMRVPIDVTQRLYGMVEHDRPRPNRLHLLLRDADVEPTHLSGLRWWSAGGTTLAIAGWLAIGPAWAIGAGVIMVVVPALVLVQWSGRRHRRVLDALPDWLDMVGRSLRSGSSFRQALIEAYQSTSGPLAHEMESLVAALEAGSPISAALAQLVDAVPGAEMRLVVAALALASENEAGVGPALAGVNQALRDRAALRDEIVGLTSQATASMYALVFLPAGFLGFDGLAGGTALAFLLGRPLGRLCLAAGCLLNVVGWVWMRLAIQKRLST